MSYICNYSDVHIYIKQSKILTRQKADATAQAQQIDMLPFILKICNQNPQRFHKYKKALKGTKRQ